jgi:hypothetical protein
MVSPATTDEESDNSDNNNNNNNKNRFEDDAIEFDIDGDDDVVRRLKAAHMRLSSLRHLPLSSYIFLHVF